MRHLWPIADQVEAAQRATPQRERVSTAACRYDPAGYIQQYLGWTPWSGDAERPGQQQILDAYVLALRQQLERRAYEHGELTAAQLTCWTPGQVIQNRIRVEAGHTVGKTKIASAITSHFIDCFAPSIIYTFAPTWNQIKNLLWKEIKSDRSDKGLPGRILETCEIRIAPDHFAQGIAASNAHGQGTERVQGQHAPYLLFILDEAEGVADFVFDAIDSMASGGIVIVLMLANPRTRTSRFHKQAGQSNVVSFRMSCLSHPNVLANRELIPGAVRRDYVLDMVEKHCTVVAEHNADLHTFELPWSQGTILQPNAEFLFRVLGIAPANLADNTFVSVGRYEAAVARGKDVIQPRATSARLGIDVGRFGTDPGTLWLNYGGVVRRIRQFVQLDTTAYYVAVKELALELRALGVTSLHIRIDAGGGFGGGLADRLRIDFDLASPVDGFADYKVIEVDNGGTPYDIKAHADAVTEMYALAGEQLQHLAIVDAPAALEVDLCERTYTWTTKRGHTVKILEEKLVFRKRTRRSPDDGDGLVLATAPDHIFTVADVGDWNAADLARLAGKGRL